MSHKLTPYDRADRLEPIVWPVRGDPDRYGKVDFDNDESSTMLTVHVEREDEGYVLHVYNHNSDTPLRVEVTAE